MTQETSIGRRAVCGSLVGLGAGLLFGRNVLAADDSKPARFRDKLGKKSKGAPALKNSDFYGPDGKFNEEAAKKAYLKLCAQFGYPLNDNVRKNIAVTDFGLGHFTEVGLAFV